MITVFTSAHIFLHLLLSLDGMPTPLQIMRFITIKYKLIGVRPHIVFPLLAKLKAAVGLFRHFFRLAFPLLPALFAGVALHCATLIIQREFGLVDSCCIVLVGGHASFAGALYSISNTHVAIIH